MAEKGKLKTEKFILDVPYYSQHLDVADEYWQNRACGMACVKMVLGYFTNVSHVSHVSHRVAHMAHISRDLDELIKEGVEKGGYCEHGWIHNVLVQIIQERGLEVFRREYKNANEQKQQKLIENAIKEKIEFLEKDGLAIVSAIKNFSEENKFHMMLLTGFEKQGKEIKGFYYHDPDAYEKEQGMNKFVSLKTFKKYWRKMSIYARIKG